MLAMLKNECQKMHQINNYHLQQNDVKIKQLSQKHNLVIQIIKNVNQQILKSEIHLNQIQEQYLIQIIQLSLKQYMRMWQNQKQNNYIKQLKELVQSSQKNIIINIIKITLDQQLFNVVNKAQYYKMIQKSLKLIKQFNSKSTFQTLLNIIKNLIKQSIKSYHKETIIIKQTTIITQAFNQQIKQNQYLQSIIIIFNQFLCQKYHQQICEFYLTVIKYYKQCPKKITLIKLIQCVNKYLSQNFNNYFHHSSMYPFTKFIIENIKKFENQLLYQTLKIITSFPTKLYFQDNQKIIKLYLSDILIKSFQFGYQIPSLAYSAINCLGRIFQYDKVVAQKCLMNVIPKLEKFIIVKEQSQIDIEDLVKNNYLFVDELEYRNVTVRQKVMQFLGKSGGRISHNIVHQQEIVNWSYKHKLNLQLQMDGFKFKFDALKFQRIKQIAKNHILKQQASEVIFNIFQLLIADINEGKHQHQATVNFIDNIFPTILQISSDSTHPSQQYIHSILIKSIQFFASKQSLIPTILKHFFELYNGNENMTFLGSRCIAQLMRLIIKKDKNQHTINKILFYVDNLSTNKLLVNPIISLIVQFGVEMINNQHIIISKQNIIKKYLMQICQLALKLTNTNQLIESENLISIILTLFNKFIKSSDKQQLVTIWQYIKQNIYNKIFSTTSSQHRQVLFTLWKQIIANNYHYLQYNPMDFLQFQTNHNQKDFQIEFQQITKVMSQYLQSKGCQHLIQKITIVSFIYKDFRLMNDFEFIIKMIINKDQIFPNFCCHILKSHQQKINQEANFSQLMLNYIFYLADKKQQRLNPPDILNIFFLVIQKQFNISQTNFIKSLLIFKEQILFHGFSSQSVEGEQSSTNLCIHERQAKTILKLLVIISKFYPSNCERLEKLIQEMIMNLKQDTKISNDKKQFLVQIVLGFNSFDIVRKYVIGVISQNGKYYDRFYILFNEFLLKNFSSISEDLVDMIKKQPKLIKLFYVLIKKPTGQMFDFLCDLWMKKISQIIAINDDKIQRDVYRLNYLFVEMIQNIENKDDYLKYIKNLIIQGTKRQSTVHSLAINLASITLRRLKNNLWVYEDYQNHQIKISFDQSLQQIADFYIPIPYTIAHLQKQEEIIKVETYLKLIQKVIYLIDDFKYCVHLFIGFEGTGRLKKVQDSIIDSIVSKYYNFKGIQQQYCFIEWVLSFFFNDKLDKNHNIWNNFRLVIIERLFSKMIHFTKKKVLLDLFHKYMQKLVATIDKPDSNLIQDMVSCFQIKQGAYIIIQNLYRYLPKPQKEKTLQKIHNQQYHKRIIRKINTILKSSYDDSNMTSMRIYDKYSTKEKRSMNYFRNYMCAAYNCLIVLFINTQNKVENFKNYLFDKGISLWQYIVDPNKQNYDFPIETQFQLIKPISSLRKLQFKNDDVRKRIRDQYMQNSHDILKEQFFLKQSNQEDFNIINGQREQQDIKQGQIKSVLEMEIEEDQINKHPCMVNILRVIDYMHIIFFDGKSSTWLEPIKNQLKDDKLSLSIRVFLTKIILNRPYIFTQFDEWGDCLIKYLILSQNGGKQIHYFYRDVFLLLIKYIKNGFKPDKKHINHIIQYLIRYLPNQNEIILSENLRLVQQFIQLNKQIRVNRKVLFQYCILNYAKNRNIQATPTTMLSVCLIMPILLEKNIPMFGLQQQEKYKWSSEQKQQYILNLINKWGFINSLKSVITKCPLIITVFEQFFKQFNTNQEHTKTLREKIFQLIKDIHKQNNCVQKKNNQIFAVLLPTIINFYPQIMTYPIFFNKFQTTMLKSMSYQKQNILQGLLSYLNYIITNQKKGLIISMEESDRCQQLLLDIKNYLVQFKTFKQTIKIIHQYSRSILLEKQYIYKAINSMFDEIKQHYSNSDNYQMCIQFYKFVITLESYHDSITEQIQKARQYFSSLNDYKIKIKQTLVEGLGNKFNQVRKLILQHFQSKIQNIQTQSFEQIILNLLKLIYVKKVQNHWLVNIIPLIFSLAKKSSNYDKLLFSNNFQNSTQLQKIPFKNIICSKDSLQQTKAEQFLIKQQSAKYPKQSFQKEQMQISQKQHIITISHIKSQKQNKLRINQIMLKILTKNGQNQQQIQNKVLSNLAIINNQYIRFKPKHLQGQLKSQFHFFIKNNKNTKIIQKNKQLKLFSTLKSCKVDLLPNIQITVANILQPLIQLCCFDTELSSQLFTTFFIDLISKNKRAEKSISQWFIKVLEQSQINDFSLISTLEKCLIAICQKQKVQIKMSEIAIRSNTIDYGIIFTQLALINAKKKNSCQKIKSLQEINSMERFVKQQWQNLIDLYQKRCNYEFLYPLFKQILKDSEHDKLISTLNKKQKVDDSYIEELQKLLDSCQNTKLKNSIQQLYIESLTSLGSWQKITEPLSQKLQKNQISNQQLRILTTSLLNQDYWNKKRILQIIQFSDEKFQFQKGLISLMVSDYIPADNYAEKQIQNFYKFFKKIASFDYNSKHIHLESIQKVYEMKEFLSLYKKQESDEQMWTVIKNWQNRLPSNIFDSNLSWIQILEGRLFYMKMLNEKFAIQKKQIKLMSFDYMTKLAKKFISNKKNNRWVQQSINKISLQFNKIKEKISTNIMLKQYQKGFIQELQKQEKLSISDIKFSFIRFLQSILTQFQSQQIISMIMYQIIQTINVTNSDYKNKKETDNVFNLILKLLTLIQNQSSKIKQIFKQAIENKKIPVWMFVYFIPQIIRFLNSNQHIEYFTHLFREILKLYPESLIYHFNCYFQQEQDCITDLAKQFYSELHTKMETNFKFIEALEFLRNPQKRLLDIINAFQQDQKDKYIKKNIEQLSEFRNTRHKHPGHYNNSFVHHFRAEIKEILDHFNSNKIQKAKQSMKRLKIKLKNYQQKQLNQISDASDFFKFYNQNNLSNQHKLNVCKNWKKIQIPATIYTKFQEPLSWNRIFIQSFDYSILILKSLRRPKRITLHGSNEKKYMFLVKGGQDVRIDQRVQTMFNTMNKILKNNPQCVKKKLQIKRFQVIPMKKMLGILQWIDQTQTLKLFLQKELKQINNQRQLVKNEAYKKYKAKIQQQCTEKKQKSYAQTYKQFLILPEEEIVSNFNTCQSFIPFGLLRKTLQRLSKSYDLFLKIKNQFLSNYAVICIVGYILGIGDRHLSNFLIHGPSASIILIDFGYSLGIKNPSIPDILPFRLTKCFLELMQPIGYSGIFKQSMVTALQALQDNQNVIVDNYRISFEHSILHLKNIQIIEKKISGESPLIMIKKQLLESQLKDKPYFNDFMNAIWKKVQKQKEENNRDIIQELIKIAIDKNILGRCFIGFLSFV